MEKRLNKNKGFSLIELLLAITLLSIIMIMVTQFMGTTSGTLIKTRNKINVQTEAMEFGSQFSDILMQATYVRIKPKNSNAFLLDTSLDDKRRKSEKGITLDLESADLVSDTFPNLLTSPYGDFDIVLDTSDFSLSGRDDAGVMHSNTGVKSLRILTDGTNAGNPYYLEPEYIYIRYTTPGTTELEERYVIYYFDENNIYMYRDAIPTKLKDKEDPSDPDEYIPVWSMTDPDGFGDAMTKVKDLADSTTEQEGLVTSHAEHFYFSVDVEASTVYLDMQFEDISRGQSNTYDYKNSVVLRNSKALTAAPQKMYKKK